MGITYLWDTNTVIYFLQNLFPSEAEEFVDDTLNQSQPAISAITEIELLCWKTSSQKDIDVVLNFIHDAHVFELEKSVKLSTAEIRKKYNIKLPDAIIAATALINNLTLISRNAKDFKIIDNLNLVNPFSL